MIFSPKSKKFRYIQQLELLDAHVNENGVITNKDAESPGSSTPQNMLRTMYIKTNKTVKVGTSWITTKFYKSLKHINLLCWKALLKRKMQIIVIFQQLLSLLLNVIISLYLSSTYISSFKNPLIYSVLLKVNVFILLLIGSSLGLKLRRILINREQSRLFDLLYIIFYSFAIILSIYISSLLVQKGKPDGFILMFSVFTIGLFENLHILLWIILIPIISLLITMEILIRILFCSLRCPKKEEIIMRFKYRLYPFIADLYKENKCSICLIEFEQNEPMCVLTCHESHIFNIICIKEWLNKQDTCPICRALVDFK